ncbi:MAG: hypothetical protein ACKOPT_09195 [Cyanobium sp.]
MVGLLLASVAFVAVQRQQNLQGAGGTSTVLKFAHGLDQNHPVHTAIMHFAESHRLDRSDWQKYAAVWQNRGGDYSVGS